MTAGPPFRAEHVGSLLRPAELHLARASARAGALSAGELRAVEDRLIERAVAKQEAIGLPVVTDGEYRRDFWHLDFLRQLEGVGLAPITGVKFQRRGRAADADGHGPGALRRPDHDADDFRFLRSIAAAMPKLCHPGAGDAAPPRRAERDLARALSGPRHVLGRRRGGISRGDRHIAAAGCAYLQLDDVSFSYLCDPPCATASARAATIPPHCPGPTRRHQPGAGRPARGR